MVPHYIIEKLIVTDRPRHVSMTVVLVVEMLTSLFHTYGVELEKAESPASDLVNKQS